MGKLEKVIVLSVLFVIAVVLVVALTTDNPIDKQNVSVLGGPQPKVAKANAAPSTTPPPSTVTPGAAPMTVGAASQPGPAPAPGALLSTNVRPADAIPAEAGSNAGAPAVQAPAHPLPEGALLVTTDGLADSYLPDMKFYTWQPGDTYRGIAATYYGDWAKLTLLRRANEGRKIVQPGEKILVPVFDLDAIPSVAAQPGGAAKNASAPKAGAKLTDADAKKSALATDAAKVTPGSGKLHVVKEGESLWKIAKAELGSGAQWEKIYQANRDVMKSPEALKTGMKLKIP